MKPKSIPIAELEKIIARVEQVERNYKEYHGFNEDYAKGFRNATTYLKEILKEEGYLK